MGSIITRKTEETKSSTAVHGGEGPNISSRSAPHGTNTKEPDLESDKISSQEQVAGCWEEIDRQCERLEKMCYCPSADQTLQSDVTGWKTARIFVSSTFRDFHSEREVLVKKVFPELREWCEERKIHLVECDLRWGIPSDSTTAATIATCLEELDRCHSETEGKPFFLNLLGERYGWIPSLSDVPEAVQEKYLWVPNTSITCMEVLYGGYRTKNPNAAFFIREKDFLADLPEQCADAYYEKGVLPREHLKVLKENLNKRFPNQTFHYSCEVSLENEHGTRPKAKLTGLEDFATQVLYFYKNAIEKTFPNQRDIKTLPSDEYEDAMQKKYVEQKSEGLIGREEEVQVLLAYAKGGPYPADNTCGDFENAKDEESKSGIEGQSSDTETPILCICSQAGCGKTSLMAGLVQKASEEGLNVFYHFVGSSPYSNDHALLLYRLICKLEPDKESMDKIKGMKENETALANYFENLLLKLRDSEQPPMLIVIDGLDEFSHGLDWLPANFPSKIRCILATRKENLPTIARLKALRPKWWLLPGLTENAKSSYVEQYLKRYSKVLDSTQMKLLLANPLANCPLWLTIACEELRVFGNFKKITTKIQKFPDSLSGLLKQVITRLVEEDETNCMKKFLCLMKVSGTGLPEYALLSLLGNAAHGQPIPLMVWANVRRQLKPFLRCVSCNSAVERVVFFHKTFCEAVQEQLITSEKDAAYWHLYLADYYENFSGQPEMHTIEIAKHYSKAGAEDKLIAFFQNARHNSQLTHVRRMYLPRYLCRLPVPGETGVKVEICIFCSSKMGQSYFGQRKDACFICGQFAPMYKQGVLCQKHGFPFKQPNKKCYLCNGVLLEGKTNPVKICNFCPVTTNTCIALKHV
ncbi:telomerase protein component 1-like [Lingula anatina]|uniref:Telomerase protein component 1-like n=1 Tax=Lingula anatina TaxID=7574 RepID=A0A1S3IKR8_LINAN|nr:telomerase protein component 1-like [Lingula anatina]XP_013398114.1 telomerase protein component 1-like [Lingula anatina]|eukprot:XP_013398113.1 telomerase protein component 1-like [Lingula anatina]